MLKIEYKEGDIVRLSFEFDRLVVRGNSIIFMGIDETQFFTFSGDDVWMVLKAFASAKLLGYKVFTIDSYKRAKIAPIDSYKKGFGID